MPPRKRRGRGFFVFPSSPPPLRSSGSASIRTLLDPLEPIFGATTAAVSSPSQSARDDRGSSPGRRGGRRRFGRLRLRHRPPTTIERGRRRSPARAAAARWRAHACARGEMRFDRLEVREKEKEKGRERERERREEQLRGLRRGARRREESVGRALSKKK